MKKLINTLFVAALCLAANVGLAFSLDSLTNKDASSGLKQALSQGVGHAVDILGKENGFLGNDKVKIPLPGGVNKVAGMLRNFGMSKQVDDLETSMNRAAEAAVPEARKLLVNAVKQMSVTDAKNILTGPSDAATQYFRSKTSSQLQAKFKPIVQKAMGKVQLADKYNALAGQAAQFGLIGKEDAQLDGYVTNKALDGLFTMIAEEEKAIRQNPAAAAGSLAQKVFGLIK